MDLAAWYEAEPFFLICALGSSALFLGFLVIGLIGGDSSGDGSDLDIDLDSGSDAAFKLFSIQSILAFFMGFGWTGLSTKQEFGLPSVAAFPVSIAIGAVFMFFTAWLMAKVYNLRHEPKRSLQSAVGTFGKVYLSIPAKGDGKGQVQVVVDDQRMTLNAISSGDPIKEFSEIEVVGLKDGSTLIVREKAK